MSMIKKRSSFESFFKTFQRHRVRAFEYFYLHIIQSVFVAYTHIPIGLTATFCELRARAYRPNE